MSAPDPNIERAMVEAEEAFTASVVRRVTGIEPHPDPSGLLGSRPVPVPAPAAAPGDANEEAVYQQYMRRFFPGSVG